jgi:hypothetical protein
MAEVLLEKEVMDGPEIDEILQQLGVRVPEHTIEPVAAAAS